MSTARSTLRLTVMLQCILYLISWYLLQHNIRSQIFLYIITYITPYTEPNLLKCSDNSAGWQRWRKSMTSNQRVSPSVNGIMLVVHKKNDKRLLPHNTSDVPTASGNLCRTWPWFPEVLEKHTHTHTSNTDSIKIADYGYMWLYGYRPKSVTARLGWGTGCTLALCVTTAPLRRHVWQLWHYIN